MTYKARSIALAVALNLALFAVGFLWQMQSKRAHELNAQTEVQNLAELLARDMEARFDGVDKALLAVSDEYERQTLTGRFSASELNTVIARQLARQPDLFAIRVTDALGNQIYGIEGKTAPHGSSLSDRKYFIAHQKEFGLGLLISEPLVGKITNKWGIVFSRRLNHLDGSFAGIVFGQVGLELIESRFSNLQLGNDGTIALRDKQMGMVVRFPNLHGSVPIGSNVISKDFKKALQANADTGNYFSGITAIDGIPRAHSYRRLPHYPFYLNVGIAEETFLKEWRTETLAVLVIWFAFAGSSALGTYLLVLEWVRREQSVNALAQSETRFRSIIEASPVPFALHDDSGRITYLNAAFTETYGYLQQDIPTLEDWFDQAFPNPVYRKWVLSTWNKRLIASQERQSAFDPMEIKIRCKNGLTGTAMAGGAILASTSNDTQLMVLYDISTRKQIEQQLKVSEARLTRAEITAKSGHWELNIHSLEIVASAGAERIYGVTSKGLTLEAIKCMPLDEYRPAMDTALHALIERDAVYDIEFQIRAMDSGLIKDVHSTAFFDREHGIVFGVIQDITEYKIVQAHLQMAASVFTHAREGITIADSKGAIMDVNDTFTRITGYTREEAIGKNPRVLKSGRHPPEFYESMWGAIAREGFWSGEIWNMRKSGEIYPELLTISAVKDASGRVSNYIALFSDIAHIKRYQAKLEQLAQFDWLTGLPNRALLDDRLNQAMLACQRRESRLAVVYIDLDGFKAVNDSYGHDVGDQFLTSISQLMKDALREGDTLARVGGDEFVAILVDLISVDDCILVLERLLEAACHPVQVALGVLQVSASIGVSYYPQVDTDANTLIKQADHAMYLAKQSGKNRFQLFSSY